MDKFLEIYSLPKLNQEKAENLKRLITTSSVIEAVIKKLLAHKSPGSDRFTSVIYQSFNEELTPVLLKLSPKNQSPKIKKREYTQILSMRPILS